MKFEQIDRDIIVSRGTKGSPVPGHARRLAVALIIKASRSRKALLTSEFLENCGLTPNQIDGAIGFLQAWPQAEPLIESITEQDGQPLVHLRPARGAGAWVLGHHALLRSRLPFWVQWAVLTIRAGQYASDTLGRKHAVNLTGRKSPALIDCVPKEWTRDVGGKPKPSRKQQLGLLNDLWRALLASGVVYDLGGRVGPGPGQKPKWCRLRDDDQEAIGRLAALLGCGLPADSSTTEDQTLAPRENDSSTTEDQTLAPRSKKTPDTVKRRREKDTAPQAASTAEETEDRPYSHTSIQSEGPNPVSEDQASINNDLLVNEDQASPVSEKAEDQAHHHTTILPGQPMPAASHSDPVSSLRGPSLASGEPSGPRDGRSSAEGQRAASRASGGPSRARPKDKRRPSWWRKTDALAVVATIEREAGLSPSRNSAAVAIRLRKYFPKGSGVLDEDVIAVAKRDWKLNEVSLITLLGFDEFHQAVIERARERRAMERLRDPKHRYLLSWRSPIRYNEHHFPDEDGDVLEELGPGHILSALYLAKYGTEGCTITRLGFYTQVQLPEPTPELVREFWPEWREHFRAKTTPPVPTILEAIY